MKVKTSATQEAIKTGFRKQSSLTVNFGIKLSGTHPADSAPTIGVTESRARANAAKHSSKGSEQIPEPPPYLSGGRFTRNRARWHDEEETKDQETRAFNGCREAPPTKMQNFRGGGEGGPAVARTSARARRTSFWCVHGPSGDRLGKLRRFRRGKGTQI